MSQCEWVDLTNRSFGEAAGARCTNPASHWVERTVEGKIFRSLRCKEHVPTVEARIGKQIIYPLERKVLQHP